MTDTLGPLRKAAGTHAQVVGDEIVVVNEKSEHAHVLQGVTADVWRAIGSGASPLASQAEVATAVAELEELGLVEGGTGMTRRTLLRRAGTVAVAGSVISIGLPAVHAAASHPPGGCHTTTTTITVTRTSSTNNKGVTVFRHRITATVIDTSSNRKLVMGSLTITSTDSFTTTVAVVNGSIDQITRNNLPVNNQTYTASFSDPSGFFCPSSDTDP